MDNKNVCCISSVSECSLFTVEYKGSSVSLCKPMLLKWNGTPVKRDDHKHVNKVTLQKQEMLKK